MHTFPNLLPTTYKEEYFAEPYYLWKKAADDDMVAKFISIGESLATMQALVGGGTVHESTRVSTLSWIDRNEETEELYAFMIDKADRINYHHFGMKIFGMESMQYTRYPIGGHYIFHNDIIARKEDSMRKLSVVIGLTGKDEYEGGDLLLSPHGANPKVIKLDKGDIVAFPSYIPHKVTPVTSGNRITVVNWYLGPKFV